MSKELDWNQHSKNYDQEIYSITKWKEKRDRILEELKDGQKILILGCGSEVYLQKDILKKYPNSKIVLSDFFKGMLKQSKKKFNHENLSFKKENMMDLDYEDEFDVIISTNSILMPTIEENDQVFENCHRALKRNGKLIAYLPSFESCQKMVETLDENPFELDPKEQVLGDVVDGTRQSFHTTRSIDNAARKFKSQSIKRVFISESKEELDHVLDLYGSILPKSVCKGIFEWYVVLTKR